MTKEKKEKEAGKAEEKPEASAKEESVDYKDKWLRALADYDNLKKRTEKEKSETAKFSNQLLIIELFPIMDSFDSALKSIGNTKDRDSFVKGLKLLQDEFHKVLEVNGLKRMKTVGEKFDPNFHEAQEEIASDRFPEGVIIEEMRSGYTLNGRLLRPALVKVSKGREQKAENKVQE